MHTHTQTQQHGLVHLMISAGMLIPHLKEHADDGHHRKPSVGQLCRKFFGLPSGSLEVKTLKPKSPAAAGVPGDWSWETSQKAM